MSDNTIIVEREDTPNIIITQSSTPNLIIGDGSSIDSGINYLLLNGSRSMTGDLDLGGNDILGLDPSTELLKVVENYTLWAKRRVRSQQWLYYGNICTSNVPINMTHTGEITSVWVSVDELADDDYTVDILVNGASSGTLTLASGQQKASDIATTIAVVAGDEVSVQLVRATAGTSVFGEVVVNLKLERSL